MAVPHPGPALALPREAVVVVRARATTPLPRHREWDAVAEVGHVVLNQVEAAVARARVTTRLQPARECPVRVDHPAEVHALLRPQVAARVQAARARTRG